MKEQNKLIQNLISRIESLEAKREIKIENKIIHNDTFEIKNNNKILLSSINQNINKEVDSINASNNLDNNKDKNLDNNTNNNLDNNNNNLDNNINNNFENNIIDKKEEDNKETSIINQIKESECINAEQETKVIEKYDLKEENNIKNQILLFEDNFKILNEQIDKIKKELEKDKKLIDISNRDITEFKMLSQKNLDELQKEIKEIKIKENKNKENQLDFELLEKKILKIIESKFKELTNSKLENNLLKELIKDKIKEENAEVLSQINDITKKNLELEDKINELPKMYLIKRLEEKIKLLGVEMEDFATKNDIKHLCDEMDKYEKELGKLKSFDIAQNEINAKYREEILKIKNSFDNIKKEFSSINKLLENNTISNLVDNLNDISERIVEKETYSEFVKNINKTILELKIDVNDHNRILDQIFPLIKKSLTIEDLNKFENSLTELIDKRDEDAKGKYADKKQIVKNIKSIESKVRIFMKNLDKEREKEKNKGAILASKPVGGYKCASCEAYLGELKDSYTFLPWNKYHGIERPYRLGSRISRILQGLNLENTFNPFIDKFNFKNENEKINSNNRINNSLSVKKIRRIPPLLHVVSEHNIFEQQIFEEDLRNDLNNNKNKRLQNKLDVLTIKSLKTFNNDSKISNKNNSSLKENKKDDKLSMKLNKNINNLHQRNEPHYYIPNLLIK